MTFKEFEKKYYQWCDAEITQSDLLEQLSHYMDHMALKENELAPEPSFEDQPTAMDLLANAIGIIAESHGLAIRTINVDWLDVQETGFKTFPDSFIQSIRIDATATNRR